MWFSGNEDGWLIMMQGMMRTVDAVFKTATFFMGFCDGSLLNKVNQMDRDIFEVKGMPFYSF